MNIKAAYYAFSRMLLPTITIIGLILLSTLSIETTFGFLMQKTWLSGILRVALLAIELVWFYYLYVKKSEEIALEESLSNIETETGFKKHKSGSLIDLSEGLTPSKKDKYERDVCEYKKINDNYYLIKILN